MAHAGEEMETPAGSEDGVVDTSIYKLQPGKTRMIRMLGNSKPGEGLPEPQSNGKRRFKKAVTLINNKQRHLHCLTTNLELCEEVKMPADPDLANVVGAEPEPTPDEEEEVDWSSNTHADGYFEKEDVEFLLAHCDPDMPRNDWIGIGSFLKNRCGHLQDFDAFGAFADWSLKSIKSRCLQE